MAMITDSVQAQLRRSSKPSTLILTTCYMLPRALMTHCAEKLTCDILKESLSQW